ncbi:MAG: hypothetical protein QOH43_139 [Solirubrobacteraceae bacterium]|jgi:hypothetical protein|nr:hypothetical protein [Solirubrobacteraceae bacterium]
MARWLAAVGCVAAAWSSAGCGPGATPLADGCTEGGPIKLALTQAPRSARLPDGTPLSRCIADGQDEAELQNVGLAYTSVADALRTRAEAGEQAAALQLGFLIGATRRGAKRTDGVMAELQRRIELVGGRMLDQVPPATGLALRRGLTAGEDRG